jgi:phage head maturation protease
MGTEESRPEAEQRPEPGDVEERTATLEVEGKQIRGIVPYNVEARLDGFTESIAPGALAQTDFARLIATIDHSDRGLPLARFPATLSVEHADDGLRWAFTPPRSRGDVIEAVERGDVAGSSWRMRVAEDRWDGDHRTITRIAELRDITIAASQQPAYETAVEYRTRPASGQEETMSENAQPAQEPVSQETEERTEVPAAGSLLAEERVEGGSAGGLWDEFRSRGFPRERAEVSWQAYEDRALTWTPSVDLMNQLDRQSAPLGFDVRYAWPALPRVPVDSATTSVLVMSQTARSLATAANVVRAVDAVSSKPETGSTVNLVTVPMKQVATVSGAIPNIHLEQPALRSIVEGDLALAVNEGLAKIVIDTFAASGFQAPGTDSLVQSVRKAMSTLFAAGYNPDTLILRPADAEALDLLVTSTGTQDYVFSPGQPAPAIWNLSRRVSKTVAAPVVLDSTAYGRFYVSPISLAAFEQNGGTTNTSLLRLEGHAAMGVERQTAAIRIASS